MFFLFFIIQILLMFFLKQLDISSDISAYIFVIITTLYLVIIFIEKYENIRKELLLAYFLRVIFKFWDIYGKNIFIIPGSGGDTEGFYSSAVAISQNMSLLGEKIYGGVYSKILGSLFYITGSNRILGQYVNVLLGIGIIIIVYKSLKLLEVDIYIIKKSILFLALFPNFIIHSAILLRENFITFFVAISLYNFIKWFKYGGMKNQLYTVLFSLIASSFHSGTIGILFGYLFIYILYDREKKQYRLSIKSLSSIIISILILIVVLTNSDKFLTKFNNVESIDDILRVANSGRGGSQYLVSLEMNTWWKMILYSPIKMIYFLFSPLPWDWRGLVDILTFITDSILYIILTYKILIGLKQKNNDGIINGILISLLFTIFIFGIGISNAGTAMRHRQKILPLFIILAGYLKSIKSIKSK